MHTPLQNNDSFAYKTRTRAHTSIKHGLIGVKGTPSNSGSCTHLYKTTTHAHTSYYRGCLWVDSCTHLSKTTTHAHTSITQRIICNLYKTATHLRIEQGITYVMWTLSNHHSTHTSIKHCNTHCNTYRTLQHTLQHTPPLYTYLYKTLQHTLQHI